MATLAIGPVEMIEARISRESQAFERKLIAHARKLITARYLRGRIAADEQWRRPDLLWPSFTED